SRWRVKALTYQITKYPKNLPKSQVDTEIARAFKVWSDVTDLTFTAVTSGKIHIEISITLFQSLYGKKSSDQDNAVSSSGTTTTTPKPNATVKPGSTDAEGAANNGPKLCEAKNVDTFLTTKDGTTYVFKGEYYWKLTDSGVASGYPRKVSSDWPELPSDLDAAFAWINGKNYFFKANDKYYRFNPDARPPVSEAYPKEIKNWQGLPADGKISAALQYSNKLTYFFKGTEYWRFNDNDFEVDKGDPPYPRPVGDWWFGCSGTKTGSLKANDSFRSSDARPDPASVLDAVFAPFDAHKVDKGDPPYPRPVGDWWFGCSGTKTGSLKANDSFRSSDARPDPASVLDAGTGPDSRS
ncbi:unnamed protein product, partial [Notodromas monacha]